MKKFAKMSLVAAVAVAGLTSYSSAASLEEAIKDTSISGYLRYRFNTDHETSSQDTTNEAKIVVVTKTKVNDNVTATTKWAKADSSATQSFAVPMTQLYFTYANGPLTVNVGRTPLVSPLTDNGNQGDGIVATYGLGPVTLAGAYYNSTYAASSGAFNGSEALSKYGVGILGSVEMVNFAGWYMSVADDLNGANVNDIDVYSLQADATVGPVSGYVFYSDMEDDVTRLNQDISFLKAGLSGDLGMFSVNLDYIKTGEDSADTTIDGDTDAYANFGYLTIDTMLINDLDAWNVGASVKATDDITLSAGYLFGDDGADNDVNELHLAAKYQMSKNFYVLGRYSVGEDETGDIVTANGGDFTNSRIELKYSF